MPDYGLSSQQIAVICALSSGANMTTAAEQAGVHRNTIANWRRNSLPFQQGFAHAQYDRALFYREKLEDLIDLAIKSLHDILTDPKAPPSVKLKAALAIMTTACTPPAPKKQVELDIEKIVIKRTPPQNVTEDQFEPTPVVPNDAQSTPETCLNSRPFAANSSLSTKEIGVNSCSSAAGSSSPLPNDAQPAPSQFVHNHAQPTPPICDHPRPFAASSSKISRNAQCPCGSGRKYKRCCLQSSAAAA
jgi:hypothetical protein